MVFSFLVFVFWGLGVFFGPARLSEPRAPLRGLSPLALPPPSGPRGASGGPFGAPWPPRGRQVAKK